MQSFRISDWQKTVRLEMKTLFLQGSSVLPVMRLLSTFHLVHQFFLSEKQKKKKKFNTQNKWIYEMIPRVLLYRILFYSQDWPFVNLIFKGWLTMKSDVYSFGVVLLEILTGRRSLDKNRPSTEYNLVEWAQSHLKSKRKFFKILDPQFGGQYSRRGVLMAAKLALRCLSKEADRRPDMHQVVSVLEKIRNLNYGRSRRKS